MIQFLYPEFLVALAALAIPIIIHLFNFRRYKKILFTNVRFLREVREETQSKSKLRHLLVLLTRMLAVSALVLAFAQPYIPVSQGTVSRGDRAVSIYLDNSFSMEAEGSEGSLLETARKKAEEAVMAYANTDRFHLLTNDFDSQHNQMMSREEMLEAIDGVEQTSRVRTLSELNVRQREALEGSDAEKKIAFVLSDFQKSTTNFDDIKPDTNLRVDLIPVNARETANLYIDTCWFTSPSLQAGRTEELNIRFRNTGEDDAEGVAVKFLVDNVQRAIATVDVPARNSITHVLTFTPHEGGWHSGTISISDNPVTFDDDYYITFQVASNVRVLALHEGATNQYINALFAKDPFFNFSNVQVTQIDYSSLGQYNLILLVELRNISSGLITELSKFTETGGAIMLFPSAAAQPAAYRPFFMAMGSAGFAAMESQETRVASVNVEHPLLKDVFEKVPDNMDLPTVRQYFVMSRGSRTGEETVLNLQNGSPFLSRINVNSGNLFVSAVPVSDEASGFARHALFVPVMYKIALTGLRQNPLSYTIGSEQEIEFSGTAATGDQVFHLVNEELNFDILPEQRVMQGRVYLLLHNQARQAGVYRLMLNNNLMALYAFNYDRKESDLEAYNINELQQLFSNFGLTQFNIIKSENYNLTRTLTIAEKGIVLWKWCIIAALLFLAVEILLLRLWK